MRHHKEPLVSCILATYDRREFLAQAIKYFKNQGYANKEFGRRGTDEGGRA